MSYRKFLIPFVFFLTLGLVISQAYGYSAIQTIHITRTEDDGFNTGVGRGIDAHLLHILDPNMDIRAYLAFFDVHIDTWEFLDNATLRITSASTLPFDADSSVTVYGFSGYDFQGLSGDHIFGPAEISSMPLTTAYVNVNTSQFYGGVVMDIDVYDIVLEVTEHPHWDGDGLGGVRQGDTIGFIILGAEDETRYFYDYRGDPARSADLIIGYNNNPKMPPGGWPDFNESYRGYNIWEVDWNGPNRTGEGFDVNWNILNQTLLTELDSGVSINVVNATLTELSAFQDQAVESLYNDTGGLGVNSYFARFAMNITNVSNGQAGSAYAGAVAGIGTATPVGSFGMQSGASGDHVGLLMMNNADDTQYLFRLYERSGVDRRYSSTSGWITEPQLHYFEYIATLTYESVRMFSDPEFTVLVWESVRPLEVATGPYRYVRIIESVGQWGPGGVFINIADYFTYSDMPLADNSTWVVTELNGTIVPGGDDCETKECALAFVDELLGGPQASDPDPPGQGWDTEGPFTRIKTRGYFFMIGFICFWGPIFFFSWKRPDGYYLLVGALIILVGLGLMTQAGHV